MYYFAYGSNMDENDLRKWCEKNKRLFPEWKIVGVACLENYKLSFNYYSTGRNGGAANLMEHSDNKVYGLLFEITKEYDHETVRKKEGYPDYYDELQVNVTLEDKKIINNVTTYKVVKKREKADHQKPTQYYMDLILRNACKNSFPTEYIRFLATIETQ